MWSRRKILHGAGGGLTAAILSRRASADPDRAPGIDVADFAADPARPVPKQSVAYDKDRPFLFDGLAPRFATREIRSVFVPMRDGVGLSTDFHIPLGAKLPLPVVLARTPYGKHRPSALKHVFPEQGFIYAVQDVRGRYESEGVFVANTGQDREDGYDTVSWLVAQPWCSGSVGAIGSSYVGETTAKLAVMRHPNYRASIIMFDGAYTGHGIASGAFIQSGALMLRALVEWLRRGVPKISYGPPAWANRREWFRSPFARRYTTQPVEVPDLPAGHLATLPVASLMERAGDPPTDFAELARRAEDMTDPFWRAQGYVTDADRIDTPSLIVTGNEEVGGTGPRLYHLFRRTALTKRARDNQVLIFTPMEHSGHARALPRTVRGLRDFGDTRYPYYRMFVDWFGHWLRGEANDVERWPNAHFFVTGRNQWETGPDWPPSDVRPLILHLRGDGRLTADAPSAEEGTRRYRYDPADPTPSEPEGVTNPDIGFSFIDRASLESRNDILVYSTDPLTAPLEIAGPIALELSVSSSARDTDFVAALMEVDAQGRAISVTHGICRMRWRDGFERALSMEPGVRYRITIDLWFANIRFPPGSRLRLHVMSAFFPFFDRNLNIGYGNMTGMDWVVADNDIHHGREAASRLILPSRRNLRGGLAGAAKPVQSPLQSMLR